MPQQAWFLYLLECENGSVYTGIAVDVKARFAAHKSGKGARYTRANPPRRLLGQKKFSSRSLAQKAEYAMKQLSAAEKRAAAHALQKKTAKRMPLKKKKGLE